VNGDDLQHDHDAEYVQADHCTPENTRTFPYQREPYVQATIPLIAGGTAAVTGKTLRWWMARGGSSGELWPIARFR
jgi:hypothetical protein